MHKLTYINSHKRNKRFVFEIFGFLQEKMIIRLYKNVHMLKMYWKIVI